MSGGHFAAGKAGQLFSPQCAPHLSRMYSRVPRRPPHRQSLMISRTPHSLERRPHRTLHLFELDHSLPGYFGVPAAPPAAQHAGRTAPHSRPQHIAPPRVSLTPLTAATHCRNAPQQAAAATRCMHYALLSPHTRHPAQNTPRTPQVTKELEEAHLKAMEFLKARKVRFRCTG